MILWPWMIFFQSHHKLSWRLSYVTLQGPSCPLLFSSFELRFSDTACDSCCEKLLHMQNNQNLGFSVRASRPFYFLQFQALTFKHCSSFSCPNTFLFDLPSSLFITEDTVRFKIIFSKTMECPEVLGCWIVSELNPLWEISGDQYFW